MKVELINVSKHFKINKVLDNINVEFEQGKIYGITGCNGSGKTLLLKLICGLALPTKGIIKVDDKEIGKDIETIDDVGIIVDMPGFVSYQTALQNLEYLAGLQGKINKSDIKQAILKSGLDPDSNKHVGTFSLGMLQRLGIAQAIMERPSLLLLDEPFNGLDVECIDVFRQILLEINDNGTTIIIASHVKRDIDILCKEVYSIENSKIIKRETF